MPGRLLLAGSLIFLTWLGAAPSGQQPSPGGPQAVDGELLVRFRAGAGSASREAALAAIGGQRIKRFEAVATDHVRVPRGRRAADAIAGLLATGEVLSAQPNFIRRIVSDPPPNDFFWVNDTTYGFYGMKKIQANLVWAAPHNNTGSSGIVIADIDTGVKYTHPDLAANMWVNPGEIAGNGVDDDANGYVDDVHGINAITGSGNPMDDNGHGTHTAGTFGAVGNNGVGVVGVNWAVKILACKFLDASGSGSDAGAIECFNYITAMKNRGVNIRVSNNSWGGYRDTSAPFPQLLKDAIDAAGNAGILNVFAAGNGDVNGNGVNIDLYPHDPASFTSPSIVSVAASRGDDGRARFSNYGATAVDLAAPGVDILSTYIDVPVQGCFDCYAYLNGTSMAAPHVAGAAALLLAQAPAQMPISTLKSLLIGNVDSVNAWSERVVSGGRLNVFKAANAEAFNVPPTVSITSPLPGAAFQAPATVTITAATADATGTVTNVEFFAGAASLGSDTSSPFEITSTGMPAGSYALTATATDSFGATTTSAPITITVTPTVPEPAVVQAIALGGSRLQQLQQANGGWFFSVSQTNCGLGEGVACPNLIGVTALGLLTAYERNPADTTLLASAVAAGQRLLAVKATVPTPMPFSQDLEFLIALSHASADPQYAAAAAGWFAVVKQAFPDAAARVDHGLATRGTLSGWDMASLIRSAKAGGDGDYARAAATRIFEREAEWAATNPTHELLGKGSLLWAVHDLGGFDAKLTEYGNFLLDQQDDEGTWDGGDLQATAYAVMGLAAYGGAGTDAAIDAAVAELIANQLPTNGWPFSAGGANEYSTVDAEVLRAIATLYNTPAGSSVLVTPAQLSTVTFSEVSTPGATRVIARPGAAGVKAPKGMTLVEGLSYEMTTTAATRGPITVCVAMPWAATAGEQDIRLLHLEHGRFVDRTIRRGRGADQTSSEVCARVKTLDSFAVAVRK